MRLMILAQMVAVAMTLIATQSFHASSSLAVAQAKGRDGCCWLVQDTPMRARIAAVR